MVVGIYNFHERLCTLNVICGAKEVPRRSIYIQICARDLGVSGVSGRSGALSAQSRSERAQSRSEPPRARSVPPRARSEPPRARLDPLRAAQSAPRAAQSRSERAQRRERVRECSMELTNKSNTLGSRQLDEDQESVRKNSSRKLPRLQ